ncbi:hypothetical protein BKA93DRAFT_773504 [Sparassis latifolia]
MDEITRKRPLLLRFARDLRSSQLSPPVRLLQPSAAAVAWVWIAPLPSIAIYAEPYALDRAPLINNSRSFSPTALPFFRACQEPADDPHPRSLAAQVLGPLPHHKHPWVIAPTPALPQSSPQLRRQAMHRALRLERAGRRRDGAR